MSVQALDSLVKRLETVTLRLEAVSTSHKPTLAPKPGAAPASTTAPVTLPTSVLQYDDAVDESVKKFLTLNEKLGGDVAAIGGKLKMLFDHHRNYLWFAAGVPEPDMSTVQSKLEPIVNLIGEIVSFKDSKRNTPHFNHLSAVAEGLNGFYWLTVKPTPAPHIKEMVDASMFYVNRVRKDHKGDTNHEEWIKAWLEIFTNLQKYVRQTHTTGLVYNSTPGAAPPTGPTIPDAGAVGTAVVSGPPAPPPPPPANLFADIKNSKPAATDAEKDGRTALMSALNQGEAITSKLKKVSDDMKTHKNPDLRAASTVPATAAKSKTGGSIAGAGAVVQKPPRTELENFKNWAVEHHKNNRNIVIEIQDMKQTVYVFKCENSVVQIKGKVNSITIDNCKKTSVAFDSLLGQIEVINSQGIEVQTLGALPTISIQKTDGCQVYLSKDSLGAEIVSSKSSEMNILVPGEDGDFSEMPIPEQFKTTYNKNTRKLETTASDII